MGGSLTREQARAAVLAFLDQFIARGADDNLRGLRQQLAGAPEVQLQLDRYLADHLSQRQAFDAMRQFLADVSADTTPGQPKQADVFDLLSWTQWEADGQTSDPAQWHDWTAAVASITAT